MRTANPIKPGRLNPCQTPYGCPVIHAIIPAIKNPTEPLRKIQYPHLNTSIAVFD